MSHPCLKGLFLLKPPFEIWRIRSWIRIVTAHITLTNGTPILGKDSELLGYRGVDTTSPNALRLEGQIRQLAFHDSLTGLPNRRLLSDRMAQVMAANKRSGCSGALLFLDLDNFKQVLQWC